MIYIFGKSYLEAYYFAENWAAAERPEHPLLPPSSDHLLESRDGEIDLKNRLLIFSNPNIFTRQGPFDRFRSALLQ